MWLQPETGQWAFLVPAGGRGTEVAYTALSLYRVVPVRYRVQIHGEENSPTWGQRLMALPVAQLGRLTNWHCLDCVTLGCSQLAG